MRRILLATFAAALSAAVTAGCSPGRAGADPSAALDKGRREAAEAIAAGALKLKEYPPLPSPAEHGEYVTLLRDRYGVGYEVPALPPGVGEADFAREVRGWNEVASAEVERRHGAGILQQLREEARRRWRERINPARVGPAPAPPAP